MYVHLVRPHLDYASQVWSPHQEAVQHRATKLMVGNRVSYKERLNKTSLMCLYSSEKNLFRLHFFLFKCLHSYYDLDISKAIPIKCFVSHRPPSREGGSVGRTKKKKKKGTIT